MLPFMVVLGLIAYLILSLAHLTTLSIMVAFVTILAGSYPLIAESIEDIKNKQFGLDYIAILAIVVALITHEYLVGIILGLMLATGRNLEDFASKLAKKSLSSLAERIPHDVGVENNGAVASKPVGSIQVNDIIIVRKGEVIPLDGLLLSPTAVVDESSLTGEVFPADKYSGDVLRSGILNLESVIRIKVTKSEKDSTYKKIVQLVERAQSEKAPLVRLADKYSLYFTVITLIISAIAYLLHPNLEAILAVLVVATPCPLILATPIALIGGMNAQARKRIIIKKLASIESLSRVDTIIFDKTGTLTLGKPRVSKFIVHSKIDKDHLLSIAGSIERNSLHPLAKAIVTYTAQKPTIEVTSVTEVVGKGISGVIDGKTYLLAKIDSPDSAMKIGIFLNGNVLGEFVFEDQLKVESKNTIESLKNLNMTIKIFTGDKLSTAVELVKKIGIEIEVKAGLKPEDKQKGIEDLKREGRTVAMVGDGINDAPALALSDVGMVFANDEQTAASEAADIVLLGGNFSSVLYSILSAKRTILIAKQSILWGIGLSIFCMILAALGYIPPLAGSLIQEAIDVAVILNALRAAR